jgi:two-component system sensor histidine kinase YesM
VETIKSATPNKGAAIINNAGKLLSNEMYAVEDTGFMDREWYRECIESPGGVVLINKPAGRNLEYFDPKSMDDIICVAKAVTDRTTDSPGGVIAVDIDAGFFENLTENIKPGEEGSFFILDSANEMAYTPADDVIARVKPHWFDGNSGFFTKNINGESYQFIYFQSDYTNWKTVGVFPIEDMLAAITDFEKAMFLITVLILVAAIFLAVSMARMITKPIRELSALMKTTESGDLSVRADIKSSDEIGMLGNSFNSMTQKMTELMELVYQEQHQKRQAELLALQAQINPHFLYNTFDTIQWMAKKYNATEVVDMIKALTTFFRIGISRGKDFISVGQEMTHVKNYLIIQSTRYEDLLTYEIIEQPGLEKFSVPKLILQPIVENAIYHGIKLKPEGGKITVSAAKDGGDIIFKVSDTGMDIRGDELEKINRNLREGKRDEEGYGIYNVNERIRLYYGEAYGVSIDSVYTKGTVVTIRCAAVSDMDAGGGRHDKSDDS